MSFWIGVALVVVLSLVWGLFADRRRGGRTDDGPPTRGKARDIGLYDDSPGPGFGG